MNGRIPIKQIIIGEGKYDKIRLESIFDALILPTDGFQIFQDEKKKELIRKLTDQFGTLIVTDSDVSGFRIRNHLKGILNTEKVVHVYIPDVFGKERRKKKSSAEGKIGVEGMDRETILEAFSKARALPEQGLPTKPDPITKTDFYELGLSGGPNASLNRRQVIRYYGLPEHLSSNSLLSVLNHITTKQELMEILGEE